MGERLHWNRLNVIGMYKLMCNDIILLQSLLIFWINCGFILIYSRIGSI